ncbi:hypothetical protein LZ30DRAFT_769724, partial [Colletotrichum cereale]
MDSSSSAQSPDSATQLPSARPSLRGPCLRRTASPTCRPSSSWVPSRSTLSPWYQRTTVNIPGGETTVIGGTTVTATPAVTATITSSASSASATATSDPVILFVGPAPVFTKRGLQKRTYGGFVNGDVASNRDSCDSATIFTISQGQLLVASNPIFYNPGEASRQMRLPNGQANFCQDSTGQVYLTFNSAGPADCQPVFLYAYEADQCVNGHIVGATLSMGSVDPSSSSSMSSVASPASASLTSSPSTAYSSTTTSITSTSTSSDSLISSASDSFARKLLSSSNTISSQSSSAISTSSTGASISSTETFISSTETSITLTLTFA